MNIKSLKVNLAGVRFRKTLSKCFNTAKYTFNLKFSEVIKSLTFVTKIISLESNHCFITNNKD